jgi:hypothetical protein
MKKESQLHLRIYTRLPLDDRGTAERLWKEFVYYGGNLVPTRFITQPIRMGLDAQMWQARHAFKRDAGE